MQIEIKTNEGINLHENILKTIEHLANKNVRLHKSYYDGATKENSGKLHNISSLFDWAETDEGSEYWNLIDSLCHYVIIDAPEKTALEKQLNKIDTHVENFKSNLFSELKYFRED